MVSAHIFGNSGVKLTPMMEQWVKAKAEHPDAILLFRMGDFYELFDNDALVAAPILELALTCRDKDKAGVKMAGFPIHAADSYINKLVDFGHKVALCEQLEDPKASKGIVKRGITQVLSPGTLINSEESLSSESNYLVSLSTQENRLALAALDLNTASFMVTGTSSHQKMLDELIRIRPKELVVSYDDCSACRLADEAKQIIGRHGSLRVEKKKDSASKNFPEAEDRALALITSYVAELRGSMPSHVGKPTRYGVDDQVLMDEPTRANLDLLPKKKGHRFNLLSLLQDTKTAMGRRAVNQAIIAPSTNLLEIKRRHDLVGELEDFMQRQAFRNLLGSIGDLEKLTALAASNKIGPRSLGRLRDALMAIRAIKNLALETQTTGIKTIGKNLPDLYELESELVLALVDQPPISLKDGGLFRAGYNSELDHVVHLSTNGQSMLLALEARERELTGINSLKVKYTRVFGYYIEITRTHLERVPPRYQRKQTIANGERYITQELGELEVTLNSAQERLAECEARLFEQLRLVVVAKASELLQLARSIAELDMLAGFAELAYERRWVRPNMLDAQECLIDIKEGRHPIVEEICLKTGSYFVPNNFRLDNTSCSVALITGPNMAGKSTIMRQVALIQIMAQMGCFVPADSASLSICDSIFARVGASDDLASGRSTFMVEMTETSYILQHATPRSLILLDEIGRGTSTYDGMSIAQAVTEYVHDKLASRTLFATHYHELTSLEKSLPKLKNFHVEVEESGDSVNFLYALKAGPAEKSFGIQVARLAGLPSCVVERARVVLSGLEAAPECQSLPLALPAVSEQPDLFGLKSGTTQRHPISLQIAKLDINRTTPLQALNKIQAWQSALRSSIFN